MKIAHFAVWTTQLEILKDFNSENFSARKDVDEIFQKLQQSGCKVEKAPRQTGDGYCECAIFDPDGNIIEIMVDK